MADESSPRQSGGGIDESLRVENLERYDRSAPLGIKLICVLKLAFDGLLFLAGLATFGSNPLLAVFVLLAVAVDLPIVYGLLTVEYWAWKWALVLGVVATVLNVLAADPNRIALAGEVLILVYSASKRELYSY